MKSIFKNFFALALAFVSTAAFSQNSYLVPDFYRPDNRRINDTLKEYKLYDKAGNEIPVFSGFDSVSFVSVVKNSFDHEHKYRDADGSLKPLPCALIVERYDKTADGKWMYVNYQTHKYCYLYEDRQLIGKTEEKSIGDAKVKLTYFKVTERR